MSTNLEHLRELTLQLNEVEVKSQKEMNGYRKECEQIIKVIGDKSIEIGIYQSTTDGNLLYVNKIILKMLGYETLEDMQRVPILSLYKNPEDRELLMQKVRNEGEIAETCIDFMRRDGEVISAFVTCLRFGKMITGVVIKKEGRC